MPIRNAPAIFFNSLKNSLNQNITIKQVLEEWLTFPERVDKIIDIKKESKLELLDDTTLWEIKKVFDLTWGLKFKPEKLKLRMDESLHDFIDRITSRYCIKNWDIACFRNLEYYFQFDSLTIDNIGHLKSINNYNITNIDLIQFRKDILKYLEKINWDIAFFIGHFCEDKILNDFNLSNIVSALDFMVSYELLEYIKREIDNWENEQIVYQDNEAYNILIEIRKYIDSYIQWNSNNFQGVLVHIIWNKENINYIKKRFNLDLRSVLSKYNDIKIDPVLQRIYLWLLDARININSFLQNMSQIILNENFMKPQSWTNLVLNNSIVWKLNKICKKSFDSFRKNQSSLIEDKNIARQYSVDTSSLVDNYVNILLDNDFISYLESYVLSVYPFNNEINSRENDIFDLLEQLFSLFEEFSKENDKEYYENKQKNKNKDRNNEDKTWMGLIRNKIFRLFREEDDPLTMIKTAQNTFFDLIDKWFTWEQVLHIMNVNYWWSVVWFYIKSIYIRICELYRDSFNGNKININLANLIYSIHDVKNADNFSGIVDYPFINFIRDKKNIKDFQKKHWMLIFDDNTSSWTTLNNIRDLAIEFWNSFFDNVRIYPCRASLKYDLYRSLSEEDKINIIWNSGYHTKRSNILEGEIDSKKKKKKEITYKEQVWTIIGTRIYRERRRRIE